MKLSLRTKHRNAGFTLLEALIAMIILAVASAGLIKVINDSISISEKTSLKTIALIIADNKLNEIYAKKSLTDSSEIIEMADRKWKLQTIFSETEASGLIRVRVMVSPDDNNNAGLASLTGFISK